MSRLTKLCPNCHEYDLIPRSNVIYRWTEGTWVVKNATCYLECENCRSTYPWKFLNSKDPSAPTPSSPF